MISTDFSTLTLLNAIDEGMFEDWNRISRLPETKLQKDGGFVWFTTGFNDIYLNAVIQSRVSAEEIESKIETILAYCNAHNLPICWQIGPTTRPNNIEEYFKKYNFRFLYESTGMAMDLELLDENLLKTESLSIIQVTNEELLKKWVEINTSGFDFSPISSDLIFRMHAGAGLDQEGSNTLYIGYSAGVPVAISELSLHKGFANIYDVATIPEARHKGFGTIMTAHALFDARKKGYRIGILTSSVWGKNMYHRIGFKDFCELKVYGYNPPPTSRTQNRLSKLAKRIYTKLSNL